MNDTPRDFPSHTLGTSDRMPGGNIDILKRLPDVAAIGRTQLQGYCDEWLKRPIARDFGITHLILGSDLMLTLRVNVGSATIGDQPFFVPICELLDYVIDQHFPDGDKRAELHAAAREMRQRWGEVGYRYEAMAGRVGNLCIKCKSPDCAAVMETKQQAVEGTVVTMPPVQITCPACGHVDWYDGGDLHLRLTSSK